MARVPKFRGSTCSKDCGGHRAGFAYATGGGRMPNFKSPSFNKGMRMGIKAAATRAARKKKK